MGLAVLTKGPVGFLLPCAAIGLYLLVMSDRQPLSEDFGWKRPLQSARELAWQTVCLFAPRKFWNAFVSMKPWILIATVCAVALPWYVAVSLKTDGAWLSGFLGQHNLGRFTSAMEGHRGPIFYYVPVILVGFFPWSVVLPACLLESWRCSRSQEPDHRGVTFLLGWTAVYVVFFSLAQTKLPNYVLPCYPAMALLTARAVVRWSEGTIQVPNWVPRLGLGSLIAVGGILAIALPVFSHYFLPGYAALGIIGILPLFAGGLAWWWTRQEQRQRALQTLGVGAVGLMLAVFAGTVPWISRAQESPLIGRAAAGMTRGNGQIATYRYFAPNLPFYAKQRVERLKEPEEVSDLLAGPNEVVLCLKAEDYPELADTLGDRLVVQQKIDRFLRNEPILILTKKPVAANENGRTKLVSQPDGIRIR
jgi:4-amino-4-deoxy-L-arabinose transferase-like glycosyltransferase